MRRTASEFAPALRSASERGEVPASGWPPDVGGGVRNGSLQGNRRVRAALMGHAPRRCGVCRTVEDLGLIHLATGTRNPSGPVTWSGDRQYHLAERLWPKVAGPWASTPEREIGADDCWLWDGAQGEFDYGRISRGRRGEGLVGPHRAVLELIDEAAYLPGTQPDRTGLVACHSCDEPRCCNPAHLSWGTPAENTQDMVRKGRHGRWRPRPSADGRAYARYLENEAVLREAERGELEVER